LGKEDAAPAPNAPDPSVQSTEEADDSVAESLDPR
jgi:hypothetical protein